MASLRMTRVSVWAGPCPKIRTWGTPLRSLGGSGFGEDGVGDAGGFYGGADVVDAHHVGSGKDGGGGGGEGCGAAAIEGQIDSVIEDGKGASEEGLDRKSVV